MYNRVNFSAPASSSPLTPLTPTMLKIKNLTKIRKEPLCPQALLKIFFIILAAMAYIIEMIVRRKADDEV